MCRKCAGEEQTTDIIANAEFLNLVSVTRVMGLFLFGLSNESLLHGIIIEIQFMLGEGTILKYP